KGWSGGSGKRQPWLETSICNLPSERTQGGLLSSPTCRTLASSGRSKRGCVRASTTSARGTVWASHSTDGSGAGATALGSISRTISSPSRGPGQPGDQALGTRHRARYIFGSVPWATLSHRRQQGETGQNTTWVGWPVPVRREESIIR